MHETKTLAAAEMLAVARRYRDAGISVLPIAAESKQPVGKWKHLETELIDDDELQRRYTTPHGSKFPDRVAVIGGKISGGLEMIDFDAAGIEWDSWSEMIPQELQEKLLIKRTAGGGYHFAYRCDEAGPNQGLCYRLLFDSNRQKQQWKATIETRGEGGYCVVAPSSRYSLIQGDWCQLPAITQEERNALLEAAKSLDQKPKETASSAGTAFEPTVDRPFIQC